MNRSRVGVLCFLGVLALPSRAAGQASPRDAQAFHARVVCLLDEIPDAPLPAGDTLLSWRHQDGPILYHTAARTGDILRAGMLRNDRLVGTAEVRWAGSAPVSFAVRWRGPDLAVELRGVVADGALRLTGERDTLLALPELPWAVADHGMDDLLLPLLERLAPDAEHRVAILWPYAVKWDTVRVRHEGRGDLRVLTLIDARNTQFWLVADASDRSFVWVRRSDSPANERRPLEGSARFPDFVRAKRILGQLP